MTKTRYLPAAVGRPANLDGVKPPAILLPVDRYDEPFVVIGEGDNATVCFLGDNHKFHAFAQAQARHFKGLAIEGVQFEVDLESMYSVDANYQAAGSAIRSGSMLELVVYGEQGSYPRKRRVPMIRGLATAGEETRVGFLRWRAFITLDDEKFEVWAATGIPSPDPL